jgi:hypothetical protein
MSEHTPGPWTAKRMPCQLDTHTYNSEVIAADGTEVATILKEPDARLMAAAPDLLAACECLLASDREFYREMARAAIKKARGEA